MAPYQIPYDYYSGGVSCGQCHVVISDPFAEKVNSMASSEKRAMDRVVSTQHANSRLACCLQIRPELNEMIVVVAENRSAEGEWFQGTGGADTF